MIFARPVRRKVEPPSNGIIRDGLLARYNFPEGSGTTTADDSGNGYDGVFQDMDNSVWVPGRYEGSAIDMGQALTATAHILVAGVDLGDNLPITFCAHLYIRADAYNIIASNNNYGSPKFAPYHNGARAGVLVRGLGYRLSGLNFIDYNVWGHFGVTYDGVTFNFYKEGVFHSTNTGSGSGAGANDTHLGNGFQGRYDDIFDDIRYYDRILSESELSQIAAGTG